MDYNLFREYRDPTSVLVRKANDVLFKDVKVIETG